MSENPSCPWLTFCQEFPQQSLLGMVPAWQAGGWDGTGPGEQQRCCADLHGQWTFLPLNSHQTPVISAWQESHQPICRWTIWSLKKVHWIISVPSRRLSWWVVKGRLQTSQHSGRGGLCCCPDIVHCRVLMIPKPHPASQPHKAALLIPALWFKAEFRGECLSSRQGKAVTQQGDQTTSTAVHYVTGDPEQGRALFHQMAIRVLLVHSLFLHWILKALEVLFV